MKKRESYRLSEDKVEYLIGHYSDMDNSVLCEVLNVSIATIRKYRTLLGLRKSREYISKINSERAVRCGNSKRLNTPAARVKRAETRKKLYDAEMIRLKWGLPQLTKRHFRQEPKAKLLQRNRLKRLGYIINEKELIAYYTPDTKRAVRIERIPRGMKKGSIRAYYSFEPWKNS